MYLIGFERIVKGKNIGVVDTTHVPSCHSSVCHSSAADLEMPVKMGRDMQPRSFGPKSLIVCTLSLVRGSCKIFTSQILTNASGHFSLEKQDLRPDGHITLNRFCALRFLPGTQQNSEYQSQRRGMRKERLRKPHSREMLNAC